MILQNPFSQAGNAVRLAGDLRRAASYKKYAWAKLHELKNMMYMANSNMIKKYYVAEGGCVDIIVQSVAGMDSIYINACPSGVGCKVTLAKDRVEGTKLYLKLKHEDIPKYEAFNGAGIMDWGDGMSSVFANVPNGTDIAPSHTYYQSGSYNLVYRGFERLPLDTTGNMGNVPYTREWYQKIVKGEYGTASNAHSTCLALPWTVDPGTDASTYPRDAKFSLHEVTVAPNPERWDCYMGKVQIDIDLSGEAEDLSNIIIYMQDFNGGVDNNDDDNYPSSFLDGVEHKRVGRYPSPPMDTARGWHIFPVPVGLSLIEVKDVTDYAFPNFYGSRTQPFVTIADNLAPFVFKFGCMVTKRLTVVIP